MNKPDKITVQSDDEAREAPKHREIRESKPVREGTVAERREALGIESERVEAGIVEEWELRIDCHENKCEQGFSWCKKGIEERRKLEG